MLGNSFRTGLLLPNMSHVYTLASLLAGNSLCCRLLVRMQGGCHACNAMLLPICVVCVVHRYKDQGADGVCIGGPRRVNQGTGGSKGMHQGSMEACIRGRNSMHVRTGRHVCTRGPGPWWHSNLLQGCSIPLGKGYCRNSGDKLYRGALNRVSNMQSCVCNLAPSLQSMLHRLVDLCVFRGLDRR